MLQYLVKALTLLPLLRHSAMSARGLNYTTYTIATEWLRYFTERLSSLQRLPEPRGPVLELKKLPPSFRRTTKLPRFSYLASAGGSVSKIDQETNDNAELDNDGGDS